MAPPPVPTAAEAAPPPPSTAEGQRSLPTPFLTKTYQLVDDPSVDDMISWNEDGSTFVVWRPAEFARDLLPKYFKHNNFSSFVRQLNTYGFRKTVPDRWEFANDCFRRGEKHLLSDIHRRKLPTSAMNAGALIPMAVPINRVGSPANSGEEQVLSSNSSPGPPPSSAAISGGPTELAEENERLRKENARLSRELSQMKSMCNHISSLISKFADEGRDSGSGEAVAPPSTMLELMPSRRAEEEEYEDAEEDEAMAEEERSVKAEEATSAPPGPSPRLFGVTIREKRAREEEKGEALAPEVKPEPEESEAPEQHRQSWVVYCPRPVRKKSEGSDMGDGDGRTAT